MGDSVRLRRAIGGGGTWLRLDAGRASESGYYVVAFTVQWWTVQGLRIWLAGVRDVLELLDVPLTHPRALWELVAGFPGWRDLAPGALLERGKKWGKRWLRK
jgi:hypothetical protein